MDLPALSGIDPVNEQINPVTVLVVDDQPLFRRAAAGLVRSLPDLALVGQASTGEEAVVLAETLQPQLILMDVRLPEIDGFEATRRILAVLPHTRVVLISTYDAEDLPGPYTNCGAFGFIRKQDLDTTSLMTVATF